MKNKFIMGFLSCSLLTTVAGCSLIGSGDSEKKAQAERNSCESFTNDIYDGIMNGESDAVLAATALYVYGQAKESGNEELIDASNRLYDGLNLPDVPMASKAVIDMKLLCGKS
jgi:hypothetical protein